jgi:hypothetical protein
MNFQILLDCGEYPHDFRNIEQWHHTLLILVPHRSLTITARKSKQETLIRKRIKNLVDRNASGIPIINIKSTSNRMQENENDQKMEREIPSWIPKKENVNYKQVGPVDCLR